MKVFIYARVSTGEQNAETQLAALRRYCEVRGWQIVDEYIDIAISGSSDANERPQLRVMMQASSLRRVGAVLVWKFDRLFRSVPNMIDALDRFRTIGVDFVSVTECIDTTTPAGRFVYTLLAAVGEFEKDLIRERTRAGIARARAEGKRIGRPVIQVDVQEAARLWNNGAGLPMRAIAKQMGISVSKVWTILSVSRSSIGNH